MARKLFLCSLIIYVQPGTIMQVIGATAIASIFTCAHIKCQPFEEDLDDNLQSCSLVSTVFTLWAAALLMSPEPASPLVGPFMVFVNVVVFVLAMYTLVMDTIPSAIDDYKSKLERAQAALAMVQTKMADRQKKNQRKREGMIQKREVMIQRHNETSQGGAMCNEQNDQDDNDFTSRNKAHREPATHSGPEAKETGIRLFQR